MSDRRDYSVPHWPCAWGGPTGTGNIKTVADDFVVRESLPFVPDGEGEHVFLQVEKSGENTDYVARLLARFAGIRQRDVGYAGLKDRHARTSQWFSLWLPGKAEPDWSRLETDTIKILQTVRHARKLKRGVLAGNLFQIRIRNWRGDCEETSRRLERLGQQGFPNYFGEQRFGRDGANVGKALMLAEGNKVGREKQGIYLSAIRSFLFNQVLAERVRQQNWNRLLEGDICQLHRSHSLFRADSDDADIDRRMQSGEIHPTGALWGLGDMQAAQHCGELEALVIGRYPELTAILNACEVKMDRRPLRVLPERLGWRFSGENELVLEFGLTAGAYATALLREVVLIDIALAEC